MASMYTATTTQYPKHQSDSDFIHTPKLTIISDHEIEIDISNFYSDRNEQKEGHYIKTVTLYSIRRIVDTIIIKPGDEIHKVIFDLDVINKKDKELCEINEWTPRDWDVSDKYHAVITCNIHGNWSDVSYGCV